MSSLFPCTALKSIHVRGWFCHGYPLGQWWLKGEGSKAGGIILFSAKHIFTFLGTIVEEYIELTCIFYLYSSHTYLHSWAECIKDAVVQTGWITKNVLVGFFHWKKLNLSLVSFSPVTVNASCLSALLLLTTTGLRVLPEDMAWHFSPCLFFCTLSRKCKTVAHLQIIYPCRPNWCRD